MLVTINDLETLALKAGGAVLGLIVFYLVRKMIRGRTV